jgi:hypothetical protein
MNARSLLFESCLVVAALTFLNFSTPAQPVVSLEVVDREAMETRIDQNAIFWAEFRVLRTGPVTQELTVFLNTRQGSARLGGDYWLDRVDHGSTVRIPAGANAVNVRLYPIDDFAYEGDETAFFHLIAPPPERAPYAIDLAHLAVEMVIHDNDPEIPVVRIGADPWRTGEPCPTCRVAPGVVIIERTAPTNTPLTVFLEIDGTATPGEDYEPLPVEVEIPAGQRSTQLTLLAMDDQLAEGPEVVRVRLLREPPPLLPPTYFVSAHASEALLVIFDDEANAPQARLDIVAPTNGAQVVFPSTVQLSAMAVNTENEVYGPVEFYAGDHLVARSPVVATTRPPVAGLPSVHTGFWTNVPVGEYVLTARTRLSFGQSITSPPVRLTIDSPRLPVVRLETVSRVSEESSAPFRRLPLVGVFRISRIGPISNSLPVYVACTGTAIPGDDYRPLPFLATIPEGTNSILLPVQVVVDHLTEGLETVVATISNCPPPGFDPPCLDFSIDPAHAFATVFIRDDGLTEASLAITRPANGVNFNAGETIPIHVIAIDLEGYISRVEFYAGNQLLGVSELLFLVAPPPGTPIHHSFAWYGAAPGAHVLTARAVRATGEEVQSPPVSITVDGGGNQAPAVAITHPVNGANIPPNLPIEITVQTRDPDGYVPTVEFFADGRKIGERNVVFIRPPDPGQTQVFRFLWRAPTPGPHILTARAIDNLGDSAVSAPLEIHIAFDILPIVSVLATDSFAVEPASNSVLDTATFRLRRFGATNTPLTVIYTLHGTAQNGVDYQLLSGSATIPSGSFSTEVVVRPLPDQLAERIETVILRMEEQPQYSVGFRRHAVALISDASAALAAKGALATWLPDGCFHASFNSPGGGDFRLEASTDLLNWETVLTTTAVNGTLDFVEDETATVSARFYRLAPEPVAGTND